MPFRSKETLEQWVEEFLAAGNEVAGTVDVLLHDGGSGSDTGLVVMKLKHSSTLLYMQPVGPFDPRWEIIFEPRDVSNRATAPEVVALADELVNASALLTYLEKRSRAHIEAQP